ncbi:MAG: HAMP domain-containing sensor histidine kinase [Pirellulaceae bacterium]
MDKFRPNIAVAACPARLLKSLAEQNVISNDNSTVRTVINRLFSSVLARHKIRSQMYAGFLILFCIVLALSWSSFQGNVKFRKLTKNIRERSAELPLAADLSHEVNKLRATLSQCNRAPADKYVIKAPIGDVFPRFQFRTNLASVHQALANYVLQLESGKTTDPRIADITLERDLVDQVEQSLIEIDGLVSHNDWDLGSSRYHAALEKELENLQGLANKLPAVLKQRMDEFAEQIRGEYQAAVLVSAVMTFIGMTAVCVLAWGFLKLIFLPLECLLKGTREVAAGNYDYRVELKANGEILELAEGFNAMTHNFQEIKRELNHQVQQRTKQVVRSEQMASVGFLAAGVAHEINNPLATIAWSAESLESRLLDILSPQVERSPEEHDAEIASMKKYLRRIQDEAFRCKGITSSLLDFSRLGDAKKSPNTLGPIIESVIEMVKPLGRYRRRNIDFICDARIQVVVNPQEVKQVILNLVTNALDSIDEGGVVSVNLKQENQRAVLTVRDNGCGMTEEVRQHLFEPFFTRRRDGQGTGLGLSISYRIIEEHDGQIEVHSEGPGQGSTFTISLPIYQNQQHEQAKRIAA